MTKLTLTEDCCRDFRARSWAFSVVAAVHTLWQVCGSVLVDDPSRGHQLLVCLYDRSWRLRCFHGIQSACWSLWLRIRDRYVMS